MNGAKEHTEFPTLPLSSIRPPKKISCFHLRTARDPSWHKNIPVA